MAIKISDLPQVLGSIRSEGKTTAVVIEIDSMKKFLSKIKFIGSIDEIEYMKNYEDVAKAVQEGRLKSITGHYIRSGYLEQRKVVIDE